MNSTLEQLLWLAHQVGREDRHLAILAEGNVSARVSDATFIVKASGTSLGTLAAADLTECRFDVLLPLLDRDDAPDDDEVTAALLNSRVDPNAKKPSVEAVFHAHLLTLPGVSWIAHCHPVAVNGVLCSSPSVIERFARHRHFPDEIVCCGRASALVPYVDPGLPLARAIRDEVRAFPERMGELPRCILLQSHGLITLGGSPATALAATLMAEKAARIFAVAEQLGGAQPLPPEQVQRIAGRPDEHYRQRLLGLL